LSDCALERMLLRSLPFIGMIGPLNPQFDVARSGRCLTAAA